MPAAQVGNVGGVEVRMTRRLHIGRVPDHLQTAVEYRDQLVAELAKVNEFLRVAGGDAALEQAEMPDFLLLGGTEIFEIRHPGRPRRYADC